MKSLKKYVQLFRKISEAVTEATGRECQFIATVVDHRTHSSYKHEGYSLKIMEILDNTQVVSQRWISLTDTFDESELEDAVNTWIADMISAQYYAAEQKDL